VIGHNKREQHYDRLMVYATMEKANFSTGELISLLQEGGVKLDIAELERTLSRLEMAFILGREKGRWFYHVPLFVEYMQEESPELKLEAELLICNHSFTPNSPL
jgi:arginine repressor